MELTSQKDLEKRSIANSNTIDLNTIGYAGNCYSLPPPPLQLKTSSKASLNKSTRAASHSLNPIQRTPIRTLAQAQQYLSSHFGVQRIYEGTLSNQADEIHHTKGGSFRSVTKPQIEGFLRAQNWQSWVLPNSFWSWLTQAFEDLNTSMGGTPNVSEIVFFKTDYELGRTGGSTVTLTPQPRTGAKFGGRKMLVFERALTGASTGWTPQGRSTTPGQPPRLQPRGGGMQTGFKAYIVHELGHGVVEEMNALTNNTQFMDDYARAIGWHQGKLYDIGAGPVQQAFQTRSTPPSRYEITTSNWNSHQWVEQPISEYQASSLSEDIPETIAALRLRTIQPSSEIPVEVSIYSFPTTTIWKHTPTTDLIQSPLEIRIQ